MKDANETRTDPVRARSERLIEIHENWDEEVAKAEVQGDLVMRHAGGSTLSIRPRYSEHLAAHIGRIRAKRASGMVKHLKALRGDLDHLCMSVPIQDGPLRKSTTAAAWISKTIAEQQADHFRDELDRLIQTIELAEHSAAHKFNTTQALSEDWVHLGPIGNNVTQDADGLINAHFPDVAEKDLGGIPFEFWSEELKQGEEA